jgi:hypothetical protein
MPDSAPAGPAPPFIDFPGWTTVPPPPDSCGATEFTSLAFPADHAALQNFLDITYNRVAGRQRFRVLLNMVFLNVVKSGKVGAAGPPYNQCGTMTETDIGFWLLAGDFREGALLPHAIGGVPAYLFVNNNAAVAGGREIWGYPKTYAQMVVPDEPRSGGPYEVSALAFRHFDPNGQACVQKVLTLQGSNLNFAGSVAVAVALFRVLCGGADALLLEGLLHIPGVPNPFTAPFLPFPVFYLKQFRSAADPTTACYQALLQGPLILQTVRNSGLLTGDWRLDIASLDSLAIITTLGLGAAVDGGVTLRTRTAFWADIDFSAGFGVAL